MISMRKRVEYNKKRFSLFKDGMGKHGVEFIGIEDLDMKLTEHDKERIKAAIRNFVGELPVDMLLNKHLKDVEGRISDYLMGKMEEEKKKYSNVLYEEIRKFSEKQIEATLGLGAIQPYIEDDDVSDIIVNGPGKGNIFIEKNGKLIQVEEFYETEEKVKSVIEIVVGIAGRSINERNPMVDARLADGSRFNAIIPPLALNGSSFSIRRFKYDIPVDDLVEKYRTFSWDAIKILKAFVVSKFNIIAAGGTGCGKTTLLNTLSDFIPDEERIITIEDSAELKFNKSNLLRWEARKVNTDDKGEVTIRELVKNALRARPDRIVVGEVRGEEAIDMLQAMNTGHSGSLTTAHGNTCRDVIARIETMILMGGMDLTSRAIKDQIASAIDVIVFMRRLSEGRRIIDEISIVEGIDGEDVILTRFMKYDIAEDKLVHTGAEPLILRRLKKIPLEKLGVDLPEWLNPIVYNDNNENNLEENDGNKESKDTNQ